MRILHFSLIVFIFPILQLVIVLLCVNTRKSSSLAKRLRQEFSLFSYFFLVYVEITFLKLTLSVGNSYFLRWLRRNAQRNEQSCQNGEGLP